MSSTNRGALRAPDDFYETPAWATRAILRELGASPSTVLEPTAGRGAIMRVVREHWPRARITGFEIDDERAAATDDIVHGDFLELARECSLRWDVAITNPPFALAMPVLEGCRRVARETVLLLRLNFLGSLERADFWRSVPADVNILPRRPNFAASLKCKGEEKPKCGWRETLPIDEARPRSCPVCGGAVSVTTSDSCEYAWFHFHPSASRRYRVLELDEVQP